MFVPSSIRCLGAVAFLFVVFPSSSAAQVSSVKQAEQLAAQSLATADPVAALATARKALALTAEFVPTAFVSPGRKGEVVEDEYQAARAGYRRHRAPLYEAVGAALAAKGEHESAIRYLRRALVLDPDDSRAARLVASLIAAERVPEALAVVHERGRATGSVGASLVPLVERAVDAEGRPSVQVEIDRARLAALKVPASAVQDGPITVPPGTRLSTGAPLKLDAGPTVFYFASAGCRTCTADLETLKRVVPPSVPIGLVPMKADEDHALRQVVQLYRLPWPVVIGKDASTVLRGTPDRVVVIGRRGFIAVTVEPPFDTGLAEVIAALSKNDLAETQPRPGWNRRPVPLRPSPPPPPALLPDGFVPPDDVPAPAEFDRAVEAFRAGRHAEALRLFESLEAAGDGRLLPPEARINRAIVLGAMGRREEARRMVLRIGDARIADAPDRVLEKIAPRR